MEYSVDVEKQSSILRKLTIKVPAKEVKTYYDRGLVDVQKTAKIKGFRPGHVPMSIIKQYYGEDVRHRVFHNMIDDAYERAVREQKLWTVGSPQIDTPQHQTGTGAHDHTLHEDQDLTFTATVEIMPEVKVKGYTGISVSQEKVDVKDEDVEKVIENILNSYAQLVPISGDAARPVKKGDFVEVQFAGGVVTDQGVQARDDMKGTQMLEIGSGTFIPGFEDQLVGMKASESKTFRIQFPKDYSHAELVDKEAEFTVTANEIKEKKLPALDDEFVKQMGYENVSDLRTKAKDFLVRERTEDSERKVKSELISTLIEKNSFDVPKALIESQTRALAQDWAQELKSKGFNDQMIQEAIKRELDNLRGRAESQVRASLILEEIAKEEKIAVTPEDMNAEIKKLAASSQMEESKVEEFYAKNPGRKGDLEFRLRQDRTLKFLLDKAKIKLVSAKDK